MTKTFKAIAAGEIPLVVKADKADVIAQIVLLKREVGDRVKFVIEGGAESHLVCYIEGVDLFLLK